MVLLHEEPVQRMKFILNTIYEHKEYGIYVYNHSGVCVNAHYLRIAHKMFF